MEDTFLREVRGGAVQTWEYIAGTKTQKLELEMFSGAILKLMQLHCRQRGDWKRVKGPGIEVL